VHDLEGPCADIQVHLVAVYEGRRVRFALGEVLLVPTTPHSDVLPRLTQALHDAGAMAGDPRPLLWQVLELPALPPWPEVAPEAPLAEHLQHALRAQIQALLRSDPGTRLGSDPEDLHQMRVATRRLRAYLRAVRPILEGEWGEALRSELAWLGGYLGPVRDLDVLLARFQAACAGLPAPEQRAFSRLLPQLERQRQSARATMLTALQSARYLQLLTRLETAAHAPEVVSSNLTLAAMASAAFKRLRKAMSKLEPTASAEALHRVRIYGKRARYTAELALVTAGKPATRFLQQAKAFQDLLGEHQDAVVAETHLRALLRHTRGTLAAFTVGRLVERQQISRQQVRTALPEVWAQLARRGRKAWRVHQGGNSSAVTNMTATPG
jgi:CHAD domain-containing protein